ncbi:MAG: toll/interleukin-1 receptor domain-containing protein [Ignavibacteriaceae bacterium]|jgi:hypothetical protein
MKNPIKVFISYSWDSEEHKSWVLNLAGRLTADGVYVILDQYDLYAGKNMTQFMERAVDEADKVLTILTKNYKIKADNRTGGVGYEYSMITQEFFSSQANNNKFIPIRREGTYEEAAPKFLGILVSHDMTNDEMFEKSYSELIKVIHDIPIVERPALGNTPSFTASSISLKIIDNEKNLLKSKMKIFGNWRFIISFSQTHFNTPELFKSIKGNLLFDDNKKIFLPYILNDFLKIKHHPIVEYERPLQQYQVSNWYINEKLQILPNKIIYEFAEYSDGEMILLNLREPFISIFYILLAINRIKRNKSISINLEIETEFLANQKSILYREYSPFDVSFSFDNYSIPDNHFKMVTVLDKIDTNTIYNVYQNLYNAFVSESPRSMNPYIVVNKEKFIKLIEKYFI